MTTPKSLIPLNKVCCVLILHLEFLVSRNQRFCCFERREWSELFELFELSELFDCSNLLRTCWKQVRMLVFRTGHEQFEISRIRAHPYFIPWHVPSVSLPSSFQCSLISQNLLLHDGALSSVVSLSLPIQRPITLS